MKRNMRLKGRTLLNADVISPEVSYAEFSSDLSLYAAKNLVNELTHGAEMLMIFENYRTNPHISNMIEMLEQMEKIYRSYSDDRYAIRKRNEYYRY